MMTIVFGTLLPWLLIGAGTWLGYQLVLQNGRILLRLEAIEKQLAPRKGPRPAEQRGGPGGLPLGSQAPAFILADLSGAPHKLSDFRGRELLLIFFNPKCGFCAKMAGDLAALPIDGTEGRPIPIVVSTGGAEENRRFAEQSGIRGVVLLQKQMEVAAQYHAQGTPMGYRIDAEGRIASELAVGAEALLHLAKPQVPHQHATGNGLHKNESDPSLAKSRLNRSTVNGSIDPLTSRPRRRSISAIICSGRGMLVYQRFQSSPSLVASINES